MGIGTTQQLLHGSLLEGSHPICRGDIPTLVFCGDAALLGELTGELTSAAQAKFALADPSLPSERDLAHLPGMLLPRWKGKTDRPIDGVCFVFTNPKHPALSAMLAAGAIRNEHVVLIASDDAASPQAGAIRSQLGQFLAEISPDAPGEARLVVVGYGHQGREIAARLRDEFGLPADRVLVHERNVDARARAASDGFSTLEEEDVITTAVALGAGVICSPLMRHDRLFRLLEAARQRGLPTLDNAQPKCGARQFPTQPGQPGSDSTVRFTAAARRVLSTDGRRIELREPFLPVTVSIVREDVRSIAGTEFPHLHGGRTLELDADHKSVVVAEGRASDPLPVETLKSVRQVFVSLGTRFDLGFFAARELALRLWPAATREVFPAEHAADLGGTTLERLLLGNLVSREVASTMQTPAQRATLGIVARHYAANRPIVEIGSAYGGSALLMAAATDRERPDIWSIDPDVSTRDIMRFAFHREGQSDRLHQLIATSDVAIGDLAHLRGECGVVFIDGLHTTDGVAADFGAYSSLVAPGGAILFHDVAFQIETVMRVVFRRVLADPRFTLRALVDGLAVFERNGSDRLAARS